MLNMEIRLIIFLTAEDGEELSQEKQDCELIVAQIIYILYYKIQV